MTTLYAQPYDLSATGFHFTSAEDYDAKTGRLRNSYGQSVEEFEIQLIEGGSIDCQLFNAVGVHQGNFAAYLDAVHDWSDEDKIKVIIAVGEAGYTFDLGSEDPSKFEIDLYECDTLRDLAIQFVDDGLFGEIPAGIANYLDYDAIAYDLSMDYSQIVIDGARYVYRCS